MSHRERGLKWSSGEVLDFLRADYPQAFPPGWVYTIEEITPQSLRVRLGAHESQLRPGGSISGPTMMHMVDVAFYMMLLALHGESARHCVTTNLSISFLRRPAFGDLVTKVSLLKHGRTLSVAAVHLEDAEGRIVGHAEATYHMASA